jgi:hypothetical protein
MKSEMQSTPPPLPEWEIHVGSVFLYLVGPGPTAMRRCSRRNINPGTPTEWELAGRALEILKVRHYSNKEAGEAEILAALVECGYEEDETI